MKTALLALALVMGMAGFTTPAAAGEDCPLFCDHDCSIACVAIDFDCVPEPVCFRFEHVAKLGDVAPPGQNGNVLVRTNAVLQQGFLELKGATGSRVFLAQVDGFPSTANLNVTTNGLEVAYTTQAKIEQPLIITDFAADKLGELHLEQLVIYDSTGDLLRIPIVLFHPSPTEPLVTVTLEELVNFVS